MRCSNLLALATAMALCGCGPASVALGTTVEGKITTHSETDGDYYWNTYRLDCKAGSDYTVELFSLDGLPVHFHVPSFDVDLSTTDHTVSTFAAQTTGTVDFTLYIGGASLTRDARYKFKISSGAASSMPVAYEADADELATTLVGMIFGAATCYGTLTWSNKTVSGSSGGTALVNGSCATQTTDSSHSSTAYRSTTIAFTNFQSVQDGVSVSGNASIDGTVYVDSSAGSPAYSGAWTVSGSATLAGRYADSITFSLLISEDSTAAWSGTISAGGKSFDVSK